MTVPIGSRMIMAGGDCGCRNAGVSEYQYYEFLRSTGR
jgi:hypothetical protein